MKTLLGELFPPELRASVFPAEPETFESVYEIGQKVWHRGKWRTITVIDSGGNMFAGVMAIPKNQPSTRKQLST